jgi:eukaryotic-like serine/threonine-protein kinase
MSRLDSSFDPNVPTINLGQSLSATTRSETCSSASPAAGRYRTIRWHAKGGVGELFLATDDELEREVALKRMQDAPADDPAGRERFFREARITGRLQHPGIVPVYGLGYDNRGRPCYAMRFVEGESLAEAIRRHHGQVTAPDGSPPLTLRQLLQRFVGACNAVAYAHSRDVVHRDLKPQNIMLGRFSETLVVDWGLAESMTRTGSELAGASNGHTAANQQGAAASPEITELVAVAGTPAFMSPEHAAGQRGADARSDVYSLGATLYVLLTNELPYPGKDAENVLERVVAGSLPPPHVVTPDVPPALEAICLHAMALRPEDRYPSALELAAEVERWLADESITVYRDPWQGRARRWGRRHPALVGASAAAAILFMAVLASATMWLSAAHQREQFLRGQAEVHELTANQERDESVRQRDLAAASFRLARDAVNQILGDSGLSTLRDIPQVEPVRLQLLEKALKFHQTFLKQAGDDPTVREDAADAHFEVGDIYRELGRSEQAINEYDAARACFAALSQKFPENVRYRIALARLFNNLSLAQSNLSRTADAEASIRQGLALTEGLLREQPADRGLRAALAKNYHNLAAIEHDTKRLPDAEKSFRRSLEIGEALVQELPNDPYARLDQGKHHYGLGNVLLETNRPAEAEEHVSLAIEYAEALVRDFPTIPDFRRTQLVAYILQSRVAGTRDSRAPVEEALRKALGVADKLTSDFAYVPDYLYLRVEILERIAKVVVADKRFDELPDLFQREAEARAFHIKARPDDFRMMVKHGAAACNDGVTLAEYGDDEHAVEQYTFAIRWLETARPKLPAEPKVRTFLRNSYGNRALANKKLEKPAAALEDWQKAVEVADNDLDRARLQLEMTWSLLLLDRYLDAAEAARLAAEVATLPALNAVSAATTLAFAAGKIAQDEKMPSEDRARRSQEFADRAMNLLERYKADLFLKNPATIQHLKTDKSFDSIRDRAEFKALVGN